MRPFSIFLRIFALIATTLAQAQAPSPRAALVIGNADYSFGSLRNPLNDAEAMAKSLEGSNADGEEYKGTVTITKKGKTFKLSWHVGDSAYEGDGTLEGNLLTVDWGSSTPVVYALGDDGGLTGLWDAGHGEETLTPEQ